VRFPGFTMPDGSYFPPELRELLPFIDTMSELKVLLCVLDAYFQAGLDAQPLTLDQIQERTGLSRYGVVEGLKRGRQRGTLKRMAVRGTYKYEPSLKIRLPCMHESSHTKESDSSNKDDDMHASESENRAALCKILVEEFGVSTRVADDIAQHRKVDFVQRQIDYARHEIRTGFVPKNSAGYIVARIRDDRPAPLGYSKQGGGGNKKRWFTDEEYDLYFLKPGDEDPE
jgi:hypothetical protein